MTQYFDRERADGMIGKHLIIGLTIHDAFDTVVDRVQLHGTIIRVTQDEGVVVRLLPSGVEHAMPAILSAYEAAPPGDYHFQNTGEVVTDPDLMTTWAVYEPPEDTEARMEDGGGFPAPSGNGSPRGQG